MAAALITNGASAQEDKGFAAAVKSGEFGAAVRYRYEHVDQQNIENKANASTARLRLNYKTGLWNGWSIFGEFDHIFHLIGRDFNSGAGTSPDKTQYPVVADPKGSDLNQLYIDYAGSDGFGLRLGRQRILLDNQRFVGNVGWRQNEQTYDGITLSAKKLPRTSLSYSYIRYVRRIFGERSPAGKDKADIHLLNAKVALNDAWSLVPYFYHLEYDAAARAVSSTATLGLRLSGSVKAGKGAVKLVGEIATQSDAGNNPVNYDAQYFHAEALWTLPNGLALGAGFESLGGDDEPGKAFRTPLATLHKFQGWADRFLAIPPGGVNDIYATLKYKTGSWKLTGVYHDFSPETGGGNYGREFDLSAGRSFAEHYGVLIKGAFFRGDAAGFPDTTKFWIQLTAAY